MTISNDLPLPPGSFGLPLLGETIAFLTDRDFASKRHNKYGQLFRTHIFGSPTIILSGAEVCARLCLGAVVSTCVA
jgi:hypothetical protein